MGQASNHQENQGRAPQALRMRTQNHLEGQTPLLTSTTDCSAAVSHPDMASASAFTDSSGSPEDASEPSPASTVPPSPSTLPTTFSSQPEPPVPQTPSSTTSVTDIDSDEHDEDDDTAGVHSATDDDTSQGHDARSYQHSESHTTWFDENTGDVHITIVVETRLLF